jgi:transposase-like protein
MTAARILKDAAVDFLRSKGLLEPLTPRALASTRMWKRPEHRTKILATNAKRRVDPEALAAMRERLDRNRMTSSTEMSKAISLAYFRKFGWGGFVSNEALDDWIVTQYRQGASAREIRDVIGMSHNAIVHRLRLRGIAVAVRGRGRRCPKLSARHLARHGIADLPGFDAEIAALYRERANVAAIARVYGVNDQAIRTSLHRSGVPILGKGGRPSKIPAFG